jgi:hypothetical protein
MIGRPSARMDHVLKFGRSIQPPRIPINCRESTSSAVHAETCGNPTATLALNKFGGRAEHALIMSRGLLVAQGTLAELRSISQLPWQASESARAATNRLNVSLIRIPANRLAAACPSPILRRATIAA